MATRPTKPIDQVGAPRINGGGTPQKYLLDERGRRLINNLYDGTPERLDMIQRELPGIPRVIIRRWAREMGKTRPRGQWTAKEEHYLRENFATTSIRKLRQVLKKDRTNIQQKVTQLGLVKKEEPSDSYTLTDLMYCLGMNDDRQVRTWVARRWLKGTKRLNNENHEVWHFTSKNIRTFIIAHPNEVSPQKADWLWLVDILAGDGGVGNLMSTYLMSEEGE